MNLSETENYHLFLSDDDSMSYHEWREKLCGENESNMVKIDSVLGGKAATSVTVYTVLTSALWRKQDSQHLQELAIEGLTQEQNGTISIAQSATADQRVAAMGAALSVSGQEAGKLIIAASSKVPTVDIPVAIILLG